MTLVEAIEIMCRRCINYEVCNGTGCEPRKTIERLLPILVEECFRGFEE